jgi:hypothetical protein
MSYTDKEIFKDALETWGVVLQQKKLAEKR